MLTKKEIKELETKTATIFNKTGFKTPKRILPNIIFDWMTPEDCFKTRMRTLLSEIVTDKNFVINEEGEIITRFTGEKPIITHNNKGLQRVKEITEYLKKQGYDLTKI